MTSILKITFGLAALLVGGLAAIFHIVGSHGRLMFRPHMKQDWVIWGIALTSTLLGIFLLATSNKTKK